MTDKPDRDGILDPRASESVALPSEIEALSGGGKRTPTQPDTSRNRPAGAPLRPPP